MDENHSEVYVAKLLEQLEELKKKKARRLEKLKKIGRHNKKYFLSSTENENSHGSPFQSIQNTTFPIHCSEKKFEKSSSKTNCCNLNGSTYKCIQGTSIQITENVPQIESNNSNFTSESKSTKDSENLVSHKNNGSKVFLENKNNSYTPTVTDIFSDNSDCDEVLNQNIKDLTNTILLNQTLNSFQEKEQSTRKRSTSECNESTESRDSKKKLKMSEDDVPVNIHIPHDNVSCVLVEKSIESKQSKDSNNEERQISTENCMEDSLSHNMTCFLSSDLLDLENDEKVQDNLKIYVDSEFLINSQDCHNLNTQNMASIVSCVDSILSSLSPINQNDCKVSDDSPKNTACPENVADSNCSSKKSCEKTVQEFKRNNDNCPVTDLVLGTNELVKTSEPTGSSCYILESSPFEVEKSGYASEQFINAHNESSAIKNVISNNLKYDSANVVKEGNMSTNCVLEENSLLPPVSKNCKSLDYHDFASARCEYVEEVDENHTPSLLDSVTVKYQMGIKNEDSSVMPEVTSIKSNIGDEDVMDPDVLTADIDFNSSMSLEVNDTVDNLLTDSKMEENSLFLPKGHVIIPQNMEFHSVLKSNAEIHIPDSEIFTIPETVLFDSSYGNKIVTIKEKTCINNKQNCENEKNNPFIQSIESSVLTEYKETSNTQMPTNIQNKKFFMTVEDSLNICEPFTPKNIQKGIVNNLPNEVFSETLYGTSNQLHTIQETILLESENTEELSGLKEFPISEGICMESKSSRQYKCSDDSQSNVELVYSFHSKIGEAVKDIKLVYFNHSNYAFIQHITWIQAWRQEENKDWTKIFSHEVGEKLQLKEICCSKDDNYLVLVLLLNNDQEHCLQFLLFEKEAKVIKLMEHTHWLKNKCPEDIVLLCGLEDLKFAIAQGNSEGFEVFVHVFNCLEENPKLLSAVLGSTAGNLKSLCYIEKLPNALMGTSDTTLYVWHLLEARLVTSVQLQSPELIAIESCIWATIENGLVFFLSICEDEQGFKMCQLLAANLATGFCQIVMTYTLQPSRESKTFSDKNVQVIYNEPFLAASSKDGTFLWSVTDEYCCAALDEDPDVTAMTFGAGNDTIIIGNSLGCVNCYRINC
ncbi:uncharacterized protein TNIN_452551 [Trichonephila inaurata madagascariensis]|uniref:Uncharacterized protein n=1 Tax=Trichonephila inaurata madagascariensis TaxID=2747483 RepID=A0A8X7C2P3_9ARAC|nr:uncharacterized protein TNIN_452551 [Trichonephila inaurata madagascariensis]